MIEKLSAKQEKQLLSFRERCLALGLSTKPINRTLVKKYLKRVYKTYLNRDIDTIFFCDSPFQATLEINILKKMNLGQNLGQNLWQNLRQNLRQNLWQNLGQNLRQNLGQNLEQNLRQNLWQNLWQNLRQNLEQNLWQNLEKIDFEYQAIYIWGSNEIYWLSFYLFPLIYLGIDYGKYKSMLMDYYMLAKHGYWIYTYENIAFVCERPAEIHKKGIRLHNEKGMAVRFKDGYGFYSLNGITVPEWVVTTPAEKIDIQKQILDEPNIDIRRELITKVGAERMIQKLGIEPIEKDWTDPKTGLKYSLYPIVVDGVNRKYLFYKHASGLPINYFSCVPPEINTCLMARAWKTKVIKREEIKECQGNPAKEAMVEACLPKWVA